MRYLFGTFESEDDRQVLEIFSEETPGGRLRNSCRAGGRTLFIVTMADLDVPTIFIYLVHDVIVLWLGFFWFLVVIGYICFVKMITHEVGVIEFYGS